LFYREKAKALPTAIEETDGDQTVQVQQIENNASAGNKEVAASNFGSLGLANTNNDMQKFEAMVTASNLTTAEQVLLGVTPIGGNSQMGCQDIQPGHQLANTQVTMSAFVELVKELGDRTASVLMEMGELIKNLSWLPAQPSEFLLGVKQDGVTSDNFILLDSQVSNNGQSSLNNQDASFPADHVTNLLGRLDELAIRASERVWSLEKVTGILLAYLEIEGSSGPQPLLHSITNTLLQVSEVRELFTQVNKQLQDMSNA
jgi:hypothetical protein